MDVFYAFAYLFAHVWLRTNQGIYVYLKIYSNCSDENTALNNNDSNGVDICSSSHFNIEAHMVSIACKL